MFKKFITGIAVCLLLTTGTICQSFAQPTVEEVPKVSEVLQLKDIIAKLPEFNQGVIYSIDHQEFNYVSTTQLLEWQGFTLEGGYALPDSLIVVVSYRIGGLKDLGVNIPVLDLVELNLGYYIGINDVDFKEKFDVEFDHGISATLLKIKF